MKLRLRTTWLYMTIFLLMVIHTVRAEEGTQTVQRNITNSEWEQLTDDQALSYRNEIENAELKKRQTPFERLLMQVMQFFTRPVGKIIIWGLFFALLAYAAYSIFRNGNAKFFSRREKNIPNNEDDDPENVFDTNWEKLLQQAIANGDLRSAVRYSYMLLLQLLQQRELIQYRSDKTNYQYLADLSDTPYKQPFKQLSRQYEYTWYGNFPVALSSYEAYMQVFDQLKKQLDR